MKGFNVTGARGRIFRAVQNGGLALGATMSARFLGERLSEGTELAPWQETALEALISRICDPGETELPRPEEVGAADVARSYLRWMPEVTRRKLGHLIATFEGGPLVLGPSRRRFSELDASDQDAYLEKWSESSLPPMRAAFHAIKQVAMMGYYSQPGAWPGIGYSIRRNPGAPPHLERGDEP